MSQVFGETLDMVRTGEGDDHDLAIVLRYLCVELPQLREMLLAI